MKRLTYPLLALSVLFLVGCGISKGQYEQVIRQKEDAEEKLMTLTEEHKTLQKGHEALLAQKEGLQQELEKARGEKDALRVEYDKILSDKVSLKSDYDRLLREKQVLESQLYDLEQKKRSESH